MMSMATPIITPTNFVTTLGSSRANRDPTPPTLGLKMAEKALTGRKLGIAWIKMVAYGKA